MANYNFKTLALSVFIFFSIPGHSQTLSEFKEYMVLKTTTEKKLDSILTYYSESDSLDYIFGYYAKWQSYHNNKSKASYFASRALKETSHQDSSQIQRNAYWLGYFKMEEKKYKESLNFFHKSVNHNKNNRYLGSSYESMAYIAYEMNEYELSIRYSDLAIELYRSEHKNTKLKEAYYRSANILRETQNKKNYIKGLNYIKKADSLIELTPPNSEDYYAIKMLTANLHNTNETLNIKKAEKYLTQAYKAALKENDSIKLREIFIQFGNLHNSTNSYKSHYYLDKAFNYVTRNDTIALASIYQNKAYTYSYNGNYFKGIDLYYKALELYLNKELNKSAKDITFFDLRNSKSVTSFRYLFPEIAETYLRKYIEDKNEEDLNNSIVFFDLADKAIDILQEQSTDFRSRLLWRRLGSELYSKSIKASYLKNDFAKAFYYIEKNKMLLILQDITAKEQEKSLDIVESIQKKQITLKKEIIALQKDLNRKNIEKESKFQLEEQLLANSYKLRSISDSLKSIQGFSKVNTKILTLNELQESLAPDEVRISYHVSSDDGFGIFSNKTNGYLLYVTKDAFELLELKQIDNLKKNVEVLISYFRSPLREVDAIRRQRALSYNVFKRLFPTEKLKNLITDKKVIISPDHFLSLLPFEALETSLNKEEAYLIKNTEISYAPSHSFLNTLNKESETEPSLLAMAPVTFTNDQLHTLSYSKKEIEQLNDYYDGLSFTNENATKSNFFKEFNSASIIHLSTHAGSQDENKNPWIAFTNEKLDTNELNLIDNNASLVFLSGCETNVGEIEAGEGVMSLARGFFHGGAQSVISTLWSIDDKSTATIVNDFYENLSNGKTKSKSLRQAKLDYLSNNTLSEKSPYYWSSFVLLGSNKPIETKSNTKLYILFSAILLVFIFFLVRKIK